MTGPRPESYSGPIPNYFVIGGPKCGSSTLCNLLGRHPDVFMSEPKEPHFFGRDVPEKTWEWYFALFEDAGTAAAIGEGSTSYTHPDIIDMVAPQIRAYDPDARLIYIVRHPLKRLESDWRMRRFQGWAPASVNDAVLEAGANLVEHGFYWRHLTIYRRYFSDDQILVLFLEDLVGRQNDVMSRCYRHLGVESDLPLDLDGGIRNQSSDFRLAGPLFRTLRNRLPRKAVQRFVPAPVRGAAVRLLTRKPDLTLEWDPNVRSRVADLLREENEHLLDFCNKPRDFWQF